MKYTRLYLKKKRLDPRSIFQLMETMRKDDNGSLKLYKFNRKTQQRCNEKSLFLCMLNILDF